MNDSIFSWAKVFMALLAAVMAIQPALGAASGEPPLAPVYNVRLLTDSTPDLTDVKSYLHSITSQFDTPQDKAIAIWRWSQRLRKQASNPVENGHEVLDPIVLFNSYGYCNCGIVSGLNNTLWLNMGWKAHYVQLGDHTVCETSWDNGETWHMFDDSMSFYCFNDLGQVASVTEIENNPRTRPAPRPEQHALPRDLEDRDTHTDHRRDLRRDGLREDREGPCHAATFVGRPDLLLRL